MTPEGRSDSGFSQLVAELRRRHVVRFALGYAAFAFVVLQLAEIVFPAFGVGDGGLRLAVVVVTLGFPPALVLAWMYDLTREGLARTDEEPTTGPVLTRLALGALLVVTVVAAGGLGLYLDRQGVFESAAAEPPTPPPTARLAEYDPSAPIRSIAVLPLDDFSPEGDQAYFTASMHEELIAKLSSLDEIRVVSRTTVMRYGNTALSMPEIGRELDADVIVEGSVSRTDARTRVTLQVIHAPSDSHIRTLQWDREDVDDILAFQTEIAHELLEEIGSRHDEAVFTQTAGSVEPAAQDAYFRGRYEYGRGTPEGYRSAMGYFEEALEADPDFAAAMAGVAGARFLMGLESPDSSIEEIGLARQEAHSALEMDSTSMEAREVLTLIERSMPRIFGGDVTLPEVAPAPTSVQVLRVPGLEDSVTIDVASFDTAWVSALTGLGERIEARVRERTVVVGPPGSERGGADARHLMGAGRFGEAAVLLTRVVEDAPESDLAWDLLVRARVSMGDLAGAVRAVEGWSASGAPAAPDTESVRGFRAATASNGEEGYWSWRRERLEGTRASGRRVPPMELATTYAALGEADDAFVWLFRALEDGDPAALAIRSDPAWDELRGDSRFAEAARQARRIRFAPSRRPAGG